MIVIKHKKKFYADIAKFYSQYLLNMQPMKEYKMWVKFNVKLASHLQCRNQLGSC